MHMHQWWATLPKHDGPWEAQDRYVAACRDAAEQLVPTTTPRSLDPDDIPLFVVMRNEGLLLAGFLDHYRRLGVTRFIVVDNGSTDGSADTLRSAPDVDLWETEESYSLASGGRLWVDGLADCYAIDHWTVFVDGDEFLVFPDMERIGLLGLARQLEEVGEDRALALMIDIYGQGSILETRFDNVHNPLASPIWFDPSGYGLKRTPRGTRGSGGPRKRLFAEILKTSTFDLTKYPFERTRPGMLHPTSHQPFPFPQRIAFPRAALMHMKLHADLSRRVEQAISTRQYWRDSSDYRVYRTVLAEDDHLCAWTPASVRYTRPEDLVAAGLIVPAGRHAPEPIVRPAQPDLIDFPGHMRRRYETAPAFQSAADRAARGLERLSPLRNAAGCATLVTVLRNEAALIPAFLAHHRKLGVGRFLIVDNDSSDGSRDLLAGAPDVELYGTDASYRASSYGRLWSDGLLRARAQGSWCLNVDVDELLVYHGMETHDLTAVIRWMEQRRMKRLFSPMIEICPASRTAARGFAPGSDPLRLDHYFDAFGYELRYTGRGPSYHGGARCRIFGRRERLQVELAKHAVTWWDDSCAHVSNHFPRPYAWNTRLPYAALLHVKFIGDFGERIRTLVKEQQHWGDSVAYRTAAVELARARKDSLLYDHSRLYEGPQSLVDAGLMLPISWD